jgi:putative transposase
MPCGFMYLVAVMDWYSRYVLAWELSNTLDADFCLTALDRALTNYRPDIFNTNQGSQFTSSAFTNRLHKAQVQVSMDGRGRFMDNIFIERLWRSYKYEDVYLHAYATPRELHDGAARWFERYNTYRPHQALHYATPQTIYHQSKKAA